MTIPKLLYPLLLFSALSACTASSEHAHNFETVKPGAAISLSHTAPQNMQAGQFQTVRLGINEAYIDGRMTLDIIPSEGLRIFGGEDSKTFSMKAFSDHDWPIDVQAESNGIYFLTIFASVTSSDGRENDIRNFSIRLDIGDITPEMRQAAFPENGTLSADGKTRVLEAAETIR